MFSHVKRRVLTTLFQTARNSVRFKYSNIKPELNKEYLLNPENISEIARNVQIRKGVGNIQAIHELNRSLNSTDNEVERENLQNKLNKEMLLIPNQTHPAVRDLDDEPKVVQYYNSLPNFTFEPHQFDQMSVKNRTFRMSHLGNFTGHKSYYLMGDLAEMEQALIRYTVERLMKYNFELISVPDILPANVIEGCGFNTTGERNQVYKLNKGNLCLSGTSEMALAAFFANRKIKMDKGPVKRMAVSRCFRAETSGTHEERGIYRVHQFNKVEMFIVTNPEKSEELLEEVKNIQVKLFEDLGLHFKLLDMPPHELGAPAYRKYDIETWMCGRKIWGEISSCSNCTDYQSRRLNIKIQNENGSEIFAHTLNGTACAVPRMLMAIVETNQNKNGTISIPEALKPFMKNDRIQQRKIIPALKLIKTVAAIR